MTGAANVRRAAAVAIALLGTALAVYGSLADLAPQRLPLGLATSDSRALSATAHGAFARQDLRTANAAALAALESDPFRQRTLTVSGLSESDTARFDRALNLAGALGWRDNLTQGLLAQLALAGGKQETFRQRTLAIATDDGTDDSLFLLLDRGLGRPDGRVQVERLMADRPAWARYYWGSEPTDSQALERRADLLQSLARPGDAPPRFWTRSLVRRLRDAGDDARAFALWQAVAAKDAGRPFANIHEADPFPWEWRVPANSTIAVDVLENGSLTIQGGGTAGIAVQRALPPGAGRFALVARTGMPPRGRAQWRLRCSNGRDTMIGPSTDGTLRFAISDSCRNPRLALHVPASEPDVTLPVVELVSSY